MSKITKYLRHEGLIGTGKKVWHLMSRLDSKTYFFESTQTLYSNNNSHIIFHELQPDLLQQFEDIKFFEHVSGNEYINKDNKKILMAYIDDEPVGYVAAEHGIDKKIHGLGRFILSDSESWIGPTYVMREYRGKGISSLLISEIMRILKEDGITSYFTAINSDNIASQKAFINNGFKKIGSVIAQKKGKNTLIDGDKIKKKFCNC